ncbi:choline kinase family protein [Microbulbifer halophilus]|uniref:Phosphotransferase n=2 Tax=Microbulbifer halophilus TaxID=453963 RepID=A0ABW5EDN0_9GAMM|nr:choline kinase family protein [Microbulbifer halophilus]MCW8126934.1 choline kinase family protein [Microbulbifer halophilus]
MTVAAADIIPDDWPRWSRTRPTLIRTLANGLTNRSFLLAAGEQQLVLRRNSVISDALDLNRDTEARALHLADSAGLCAPLVYCDPEHRYLVTRYVPGDRWSPDNAGAFAQLAALLRGIHRLPAIDAELDIGDKIDHYRRSIDTGQSPLRSLQSLHQPVQRHVVAAGESGNGKVLCHNDLLADNLITGADGTLYAIDWEYAATGDPFYDLAVICEGQGLDGDQREKLLAEYLRHPVSDIDRQRLDHWRIIYGYLSLLWYAVQWSCGALGSRSMGEEISGQIESLSELISITARGY